MPNILDRPYAGNWQQNNRSVVKHTPDALIYVNGDIAIPGCPRCNGRIDIQRFVKQISVEAGTNPGAHSGTAQLSVPIIFGEQIFREGKALLQPSLEVHVYMRGYFPVQGQFAHLREEDITVGDNSINLERYATYPYYHVFHGVITSVSWNYSDGFYDASIQFGSLLHFWQYHNMATNASILGARPNNSEAKMNIWGNIYNGMHPYAIIYDLYRNTAGNAGGIEFNLNDQTNVDAVSRAKAATAGGGQTTLYKQQQLYWEERFKTTVQNLRMYGVNGRLYNAAQQAFIGRRNSTKLTKLLNHTKHLDMDALDNKKDWTSTQLALANRLGLQGEGLDLAFSPALQRQGAQAGDLIDTLNFNVTSIFAFTPNISSAQIQEFETQYMTKLEIAQQVTNATGYEFYQDVDGDLVFKPPFYNLDTRASRVYRLEDIDIISASFQEKEPQATYCTVKAGTTTSFNVGTPGWVGARGQYIDWRLIAKFGWRPANMEISYYNSPKALFFIAQARLDILNIDINSCQVTIPIRPELRPGFPVYIPFVDCFYYVTQMSHSFSFGANCTTSLTLTGRRTKWMPPGEPGPIPPGENVIEKVRLDQPWLPERPIEVYENGIPRWVGMPNVVMALDPLRVNPKYFMLLSGLESLDTEINSGELLFNIIREQVKNTQEGAGIFSILPGEDSDNPTKRTRYRLRQSDDPEDDIVFTLESLQRDAEAFDAARKEILAARKQLDRKADQIRRAAGPGSQTVPGGTGDIGGRRAGTNTTKLQADFATASAKLAEARAGLNPDGDDTTNTIVLLIQALANNDFVRQAIDGIPDSPPTAAWLDILGDTKQSFLPGTNLPGYYRYYSCAHPDPEMQGQAALAFDEGSGTDIFVAQERTLDKPAQPNVNAAPEPEPEPEDEEDEPDEEDEEEVQGEDILAEFDRRAKELGVDNFGDRPSRQFFKTTTPENRARKGSGSQKRLPDEFPTRKQMETMLNTAVTVQEFRERVGLPMNIVQGWRAIKFEKQDDGSQKLVASQGPHQKGEAVDIRLSPRPAGNRSPENIEKFRTTAALMAAEGKIKGLGFYGRGNMDWHIHIDIRSRGGCPSTWHHDPRTSETIDFYNQVAFQNGFAPGQRNGVRSGECPRVERPVRPERSRPPNKPRKPKPTPPPTPIATGTRAKIRVESQFLPNPRPVEGFIRGPLETPAGVTRPPQAQLGRILCERGLKVAVPRSSSFQVVPSSDIQTLTFTRSDTKKAVNVSGLANEQGSYEPTELQAVLTRLLVQRFRSETQDQVNSAATTPRDFLGDIYDQIREDLQEGAGEDFTQNPNANTYPIYEKSSDETTPPESRFILTAFANVALPTFTDAVTGDVPATVDDEGNLVIEDTEPVSIADLPLSEVVTFEGFSAKTFDQIVDKVNRAYVAVIVRAVVDAYEGARVRAGFVQGKRPNGFNQRMALVADAFSNIALTVTRVQFDVRKQATNARALRAAKKTKGIFTPIFPVSDGAGYEHIGSFRYGRGLTVEPGGSFDAINNSPDPFSGVSAATAEAFLSALTNIQRVGLQAFVEGDAERIAFVQAQKERLQAEQLELEQLAGDNPSTSQSNSLSAQRIRTLTQVRLALVQLQETNPAAFRELLEANGVEDVESLTFENPNPNAFETKFANFPANQLRDGVFKTTVVNAAFNLSDLEPHLQQKTHTTCACQGNASYIQLAAFGRNDFLTINEISAEDDPATASLSEEIIQSLPDYLGQRQALRGQQLDVRGSTLAEAFGKIKDIRNTITQTSEQLRQAGQEFREAGDAFRDININLGGG